MGGRSGSSGGGGVNAVHEIGRRGGILAGGEYLRDGMRSLESIRKAFAGATGSVANAIATGKRDVIGGGSGRLKPIVVDIEVERSGRRRVFLQDGRHRSTAAKEAGATHIMARVRVNREGKNGHWYAGTYVNRIVKL